MNTDIAFFRLPQELREQIYSYLFDKDEPYVQELDDGYRWSELLPPPHCTGAMRLWIENGDLVTQRTWHNRRLAKRVHDRAAILRTCRKVYEDASEYLYSKTIFMIFNSQKYEKKFKQYSWVSDWDAEENRVAQLVSERPRNKFPFDKWPYRVGPGAEFMWFGPIWPTMWTPARCELMGTISNSDFLKRMRHVRIRIWAKKPEDLGKMIAILEKLYAVVPDMLNTFDFSLRFNEPRRRGLRPFVDEAELQRLLAILTKIKTKYSTSLKVSILVDSAWWIAGFRKQRLLALDEICRPHTMYPNPRYYPTPGYYDRHLRRWRIPYCDVLECECCMNCRLAAAWFGETR